MSESVVVPGRLVKNVWSCVPAKQSCLRVFYVIRHSQVQTSNSMPISLRGHNRTYSTDSTTDTHYLPTVLPLNFKYSKPNLKKNQYEKFMKNLMDSILKRFLLLPLFLKHGIDYLNALELYYIWNNYNETKFPINTYHPNIPGYVLQKMITTFNIKSLFIYYIHIILLMIFDNNFAGIEPTTI